jgi:hypothetical protein
MQGIAASRPKADILPPRRMLGQERQLSHCLGLLAGEKRHSERRHGSPTTVSRAVPDTLSFAMTRMPLPHQPPAAIGGDVDFREALVL